MPRTTRKPSSEATPLYAIAGAGDLAVEKIRALSKIASQKFSELEATDPAKVSDRVQGRLEEGADALATALRTASTDIMDQAKGISDRAQAAFQAALIQAGDTYDVLAQRGERAVVRMRSKQNGRQIQRPSTSRAKSTTRKRATTKKATSPTTRARKSTRSTAKKSSSMPAQSPSSSI
ncbi:hypothetical protein [Actinopolymorpha alba]|uniref:hypothetical protein n=1 Tax=Actinopolymorpha alba TaxID=533267 RepID=UPI00036827F5|nr:hypothetical protein [Actinopolymorpha alba]